MKKIETGTLVKCKYDGSIGLITKIMKDPSFYPYWIEWNDGSAGDFYDVHFEVLS